ncbi:outer membrane beta-barrel protein [Ferruginibacter profundus]
MKKVLVAALTLVTVTQAVNAQKGSVLLYGNLAVNSSKDASDSKNSSFSVMPGIGYQFADEWTAGINLGVNGSKDEIGTSGNYNKISGFTAGPFVRYTKTLGNIFSIFGHANFNYSTSKYKPFTGTNTTVNGFGINIFPAVGVNVKNGFALNFGFGGIDYGTSKADVSGAKSANSFSLTFGQQVNVGISKNFGPGKKK